MDVWMHGCMHACMYACMHVCMCAYVYIFVYVSMYIYTYIYMYICIDLCMYLCIDIYIYIRTCTHWQTTSKKNKEKKNLDRINTYSIMYTYLYIYYCIYIYYIIYIYLYIILHLYIYIYLCVFIYMRNKTTLFATPKRTYGFKYIHEDQNCNFSARNNESRVSGCDNSYIENQPDFCTLLYLCQDSSMSPFLINCGCAHADGSQKSFRDVLPTAI